MRRAVEAIVAMNTERSLQFRLIDKPIDATHLATLETQLFDGFVVTETAPKTRACDDGHGVSILPRRPGRRGGGTFARVLPAGSAREQFLPATTTRGGSTTRRDEMTIPNTDTGPAPKPAHTRAGIASMIKELRALHMTTERDRELAVHLDRLLTVDAEGRQMPEPIRFTEGMETRGIIMIEPAGGGKTKAIRRLLMGTAALNPEGGTARHLQLQVPSPATLKSLGLAILRAAGLDGVSPRSTAWDIWGVVRHRLGILGVVVLWIDEAHDMFLSGATREIDDMLRMLKSLMLGENAVIVILSGADRLAEVASYDPQVNRRFSRVVPKDLVVGASDRAVSDLVARYAGRAGLRLDWSDALSGRLIHASRGRFGRTVETVVNAIERALSDGEDTLGLAHFAEAWSMYEGCAWEDNVFVTHDWATRRLDGAAEEYEAARATRQRKRIGRA